MSYFIRQSSRPWIEAAEAARATGPDSPPPHGRSDEGVAQLRADYGRVSRWLLGIGATLVGAIAAMFFGVGVGSTVDPSLLPADRVVGAALGIGLGLVVAAPAVWLLVALHRSGRRLAIGLAFWAALPYRTGRRSPEQSDYFAVRFLAFEPYLLIRVTTSVLACLGAVFAVAMLFYGLFVAPLPSLAVWGALAGVLLGAVAIGQFGGVQRIQSGYAARDPWADSWRRRQSAASRS